MKSISLGLVLFLALNLSITANAQTEYPIAEDVASPEAIITAAYESLARAPGENYDWDRFRSLFIAEAKLIPNKEQTGGSFAVLTPQGFIDWADRVTVIGGANDKGFAEEAIHNKIERYGDIAHAFSSYQKHFWKDSNILGRGINSFQMVYHENRWWITGIIWDEETGAGIIPNQYLSSQ